LKQSASASHVQVIALPYSLKSDEAAARDGSSKVLSFLRRRSRDVTRACDPGTFRDQIVEYLAQARDARAARAAERAAERSVGMPPPAAAETALVARRPTSQRNETAQSVVRPHPLGGSAVTDRRRARRRTAADLPGLWAIRLPLGPDAKVVDISSTGVLVETVSKITPGSTLDLQLVGQDINLRVPARAVRSEVASVDRLGVRYRAAAAFSHELDILGLRPVSTTPGSMPRVLADLLGRVLSDANGGSGSSSVHARFERELRQLVAVRDIQIRRAPAIPNERSDSVYFTVPRVSGSRSILQAVFEPDYQPTAAEFRILKAAASAAAVLLELAPIAEEASGIGLLTS
jgi:hypothetical protein